MKTATFFLTTVVALLGISVASNDNADRDAQQKIMTAKLESAQKVLEGLSSNNYELVGRHADLLIQVSKQMEPRLPKTAQSEMNSNDFRRAAQTIAEQAKAKNSEGIALAFSDLTMSCVRCHKHVREVRMASLDVAH
jgi:cytochrome c556